ncbi:MAG: 6-phosphofructokinase [Verrucomicrobiota bacterium]|nr:6-phosphofructokinase [Verrucomicrobiota bacterium]
MAEELIGNCLVAQSGGPTAVINASVAGVVSEALNHECIEEVYGGINGVLGILKEEIIDLAEESQQNIRGLRYTPASALGTCRFKLKREVDYERILEVFEAHNIRYFFYCGGNDSQDTADKISKLAQKKDYALRVIGVPKTIDNDLVLTDHCPGYGSVVKYLCTIIRETALDHEAMGQHDLVSIIEVMGRNAGWIAAGTTLAKSKENPNDAPHLIYLPELPFSKDKFVDDVQRILKKNKYCLVIVGEGLIDKDGNYVANSATGQDAFGHQQLGGVGDFLANHIEENLAVKARSSKLGTGQRAAAHCSSKTDNDEAFMAGQAAVKAAIEGETDKMVILVRAEGDAYSCETSLAPLSEIANGVKEIPQDWISEDGVSMTAKFIKYCQPLVQGEVEVPYENGVPNYVRLSNRRVRKVLDPHEFE